MQDFIFTMSSFNIKPDLVIATPPKILNLPETILDDKYKHHNLMPPKEICRLLAIEYIEKFHTEHDVPHLLKRKKIELGIIAGARILEKRVIESVPLGIINFHPGLIPENRGLNSAKWAIFMNIPQGITTHLIDNRVDAGKIIKKYIINIFPDDTLPEINLRLHEAQIKKLIEAIHILKKSNNLFSIPFNGESRYHPPADKTVDTYTLNNFHIYKEKWTCIKNGWTCICGEKLKDFNEDGKCRCGFCRRSYRKSEDLLEVCL